jgi:hypothetical protein
MVDPKPTSKNKWMNRWGWTSRKLAQKTMVGLDMPSSLSNKNLQMVCLVHQLSLGGDCGTCPTLLLIGKKLISRENKAILPIDHEIIYMYALLQNAS